MTGLVGVRPVLDLSIWPRSTRELNGGDLEVGGVSLAAVAGDFGTPTYVLDELEVRRRCRDYQDAFPGATVAYAAKAFLSRGIAAWVHNEGLGLDVCSAGEIELAVSAGLPPEHMIMHGNAKSPEDMHTALRVGVGRIVVDNIHEIAHILTEQPRGRRQKILVRVIPGISAGAHAKIQTGGEHQQFGLSIADGSALHAISRILSQPDLELVGLHCHLGSQITEVKPFLQAVQRLVHLLGLIRDRHGIELPELDLGGGHGVAYRPGGGVLDIAVLGARVRAELAAACEAAQLSVPRLTVEPGRAIVGPAGIALYRVLAVKHVGGRLFVAVDGGMSDNPRHALYGAEYSPHVLGYSPNTPRVHATLVGHHCETGDVLADDVLVPDAVRAGDLVAVPVSGAYQLSMASTYNLAGRPPVVAVALGHARLLVRRESLQDMTCRDVGA